MWRNWSPPIQLVRMKNGAAAVEDTGQLLKKLNVQLPYDPAIPLLDIWIAPKRNQNLCSHKNLSTNIHSSVIHNGQRETTQTSTTNEQVKECGPSTHWNNTQPWKGVRHWRSPQRGWTSTHDAPWKDPVPKEASYDTIVFTGNTQNRQVHKDRK